MGRNIPFYGRSRVVVAALALTGGLGSFLAHQSTSVAASTHSVRATIPVLSLKGSNGYRINVSGYDHRSSSRVSLTASKHGRYACYTVPGVAKGGRIMARFPGLGKVAVRFVPDTANQQASRSARKARRAGTDNGTFVGTIAFRGERHFTSVTASRANGSIVSPAPKKSRLILRRSPNAIRNWTATSSSWVGSQSLEVASGDIHFYAERISHNGVEELSASFEA